MYQNQGRNAYRTNQTTATIHPVKLINMMYERALAHLAQAEDAILAKDVEKRGQNLSKTIAIVAELNASIKGSDQSEAADFLRGIYTAILTELPNITRTGDIEKLRLAYRYMKKLKDVWNETAMREAGLAGKPAESYPVLPKENDNRKSENKGFRYGSPSTPPLKQGLSVAI